MSVIKEVLLLQQYTRDPWSPLKKPLRLQSQNIT
jgi:hypothetical protein